MRGGPPKRAQVVSGSFPLLGSITGHAKTQRLWTNALEGLCPCGLPRGEREEQAAQDPPLSASESDKTVADVKEDLAPARMTSSWPVERSMARWRGDSGPVMCTMYIGGSSAVWLASLTGIVGSKEKSRYHREKKKEKKRKKEKEKKKY